MNHKAFINLYNFVTESSDNIHNSELVFLEGMKPKGNPKVSSILSDGISIVPLDTVPVEYMNNQMNIWRNISEIVPYLESFYSEIYTRKDFLNNPAISIAILNANEVGEIKPQYLKRFLEECFYLIDETINSDKSDTEVKVITEKMLHTLKRNVVVTSMPEYAKSKDFVTFNNRTVREVNQQYIQNHILPFLRTTLQEIENTDKVIKELTSIMLEGGKELSLYNETVNRLYKENKIKNPNRAFQILFSCINIYLDASKYIISHLLRKMYIHISITKEYTSLKDALSKMFGYDSINESVDENDPILSILNKTYNYYYKDALNMIGGNESKLNESISNSPYQQDIFFKYHKIIKEINKSIDTLALNSCDEEYSIEDLKSMSNLTGMVDRYKPIINSTENISMYTNAELKPYDIRVVIIKELDYAKKFFSKSDSVIDSILGKINKINDDISTNKDNVYGNIERNKEEVDLLSNIYNDIKFIKGEINDTYILRISKFDNHLSVYKNPGNISLEYVEESYLESAANASIDIQNIIQKYEVSNTFNIVESALLKDKVSSDPIIFVEADQPVDNQNNTNNSNSNNTQNTNNQTNNTNKPNNNNQNSNDANKPKQDTKPTVSDNSNTNDSNNKSFKDTITAIFNKIKEFANNLKDKLSNAIAKLKGNLEWLNKNEEALRNRSYNNVSVDILPYNNSVKYVELIDICTNVFQNDIKPERIANGSTSEEKIEAMIRTKLRLNKDNTKIGEKILISLKSSGSGIKTQTFSNGRLAQEIGVMIDFCKYYYDGFENDFKSAVDRLTDAVNTLENNVNNFEKTDKAVPLLQYAGTLSNTVTGTILEVARDRANDYMKVLNELLPKQKKSTSDSSDNKEDSESNNSQLTT